MKRRRETTTNYWISYSDLMAGLLFVFFAIIVVSNIQTKRELEKNQAKLELIGENIALRKDIAAILQEKFDQNNIKAAKVDPMTGNIEFVLPDENRDLAWFKTEKADLLSPAKRTIDKVIPIYLEVLFNENITKGKLDRILIEGHASKEFNYRYLDDLILSQNRAFAVGKYIIETNINCEANLRKYLVALGRSFADAKYAEVLQKDGTVKLSSDRWLDRKVLIRYTLQYEQMMKKLQKN